MSADFSSLFQQKKYLSQKSKKKQKELEQQIQQQKAQEQPKQKKRKRKESNPNQKSPTKKRKIETSNQPDQHNNQKENDDLSDDPLLHQGYRGVRLDQLKKTNDEVLLREEVTAFLNGDLFLDDFDEDEVPGLLNEVDTEVVEDLVTVFVGGVPHEVTPSEVKKYFKQFGVIRNIRVLGRHSEDRETYVCFMDFRGEKAAEEAITLNGTMYKGKILDVRLASDDKKPNSKKKNEKIEKNNTTIFVKDLPETVTQKQLRKLFVQYGKIKTIKIPLQQDTGTPKGFAFVTFQNKSSIKQVLSNTFKLNDKDITVELSTPK